MEANTRDTKMSAVSYDRKDSCWRNDFVFHQRKNSLNPQKFYHSFTYQYIYVILEFLKLS